MSARNVRTIWQGLSLAAAVAMVITLMPVTAQAQANNLWKLEVDAESTAPDKLQLQGEGPNLTGAAASGGLTGAFLIEYPAPLDQTIEFAITNTSVGGSTITVTGASGVLTGSVTINLSNGDVGFTCSPLASCPIGGDTRSWNAAADSVGDPGDKVVMNLSLDGANLP